MPKSPSDRWVEKLFWGLLLGIASFGVSEIKSMSTSIQQLNITMASVVTNIADQGSELKDHGNRIRELELKRR